MKKKVCLTTLEYPPAVGGVGESAQRIAKMLVELGYDVHVAIFRAVFWNEKQEAATGEFHRSRCLTEEQEGIIVHRLFPAVRSRSAREQDYLSDLYGQLERLHQKYNFDLFHAFFINETGFLSTLLGRENGFPVINSVRGADLHKHVFAPKQNSQIQWTLKNSSWTTFVSRYLMRRARVLVPSIAGKSSAFWNSIVPIEFGQLPAPPLRDRLQGTVIGSTGNFRDKKGVEYLLDACKKLASERELTLLLVGDFVEKELQYWEQELHNSGLGDRIVITGKISRTEALAYLLYMDIFTLPSITDGCPNALLEAMLAGNAIVGTNVDAIGEILEDGIDGLLVNPHSSEELTVALRRLAENAQMRDRFGAAAKQKVLTQLSPALEQENWDWVYRQVLGETAKPRLEVASIA